MNFWNISHASVFATPALPKFRAVRPCSALMLVLLMIDVTPAEMDVPVNFRAEDRPTLDAAIAIAEEKEQN